jgi:hypothetical protein
MATAESPLALWPAWGQADGLACSYPPAGSQSTESQTPRPCGGIALARGKSVSLRARYGARPVVGAGRSSTTTVGSRAPSRHMRCGYYRRRSSARGGHAACASGSYRTPWGSKPCRHRLLHAQHGAALGSRATLRRAVAASRSTECGHLSPNPCHGARSSTCNSSDAMAICP